jgi:hypothetical protein
MKMGWLLGRKARRLMILQEQSEILLKWGLQH